MNYGTNAKVLSVDLNLPISLSVLFIYSRSGYNCVIYGWDPKCTMSQEWITTMRVHHLSNGDNQPFYNVLVQDGTCRYAAQGTDHTHGRSHVNRSLRENWMQHYEIYMN